MLYLLAVGVRFFSIKRINIKNKMIYFTLNSCLFIVHDTSKSLVMKSSCPEKCKYLKICYLNTCIERKMQFLPYEKISTNHKRKDLEI